MVDEQESRQKIEKLLEEVDLNTLFLVLGDIFWERYMDDRRNLWYLDLVNNIGTVIYGLTHKRFKNN